MIRPNLLNYVAFPVLLVAAVLQIFWVWGLLFLWWAIQSLRLGTANLVHPIRRAEDPILFWLVLVMWSLSGVAMIAASLFPAYAIYLT